MTGPFLPTYGAGSLTDVLASVGHHLGVPGCRGDSLSLPPGDRWVVLLVDGLGWDLLRAHRDDAPYLSGHRLKTEPITTGVPSTTATSLTSLGTGLPPGMHGIAGYTMLDPAQKRIFSPLTWDTPSDPLEFQPMPTIFERARAAGVTVTTVLPERFDGSGLTQVGLRGGRFDSVDDEDDDTSRLSQTVAASARGERSLVYVYDRLLDHAGHSYGTTSHQWLTQLMRIDGFAEDLRAALPESTRLVITGDHGMVDVPREHRYVIEDDPDLLRDVDFIGGEARLRQLYTVRPDEVAATYRSALGEHAWVRTRAQATAEGWFGKSAPRVANRFGDVLVAMCSDWAILTAQVPGEFGLFGMHGSLTEAEMRIPLIVD